jgi:hypothetical protein
MRKLTHKDIFLIFDSNNTNPSSTTVDSSQHYPFNIYGQQLCYLSYDNNIDNYQDMLIQEAGRVCTSLAKRTADEVINEYLQNNNKKRNHSYCNAAALIFLGNIDHYFTLILTEIPDIQNL